MKYSFLIFIFVLFSVYLFGKQTVTNDSVVSVISEAERNVEVAESSDNKDLLSNAFFDLGMIYFENEYFGDAYEMFNKSIDIIKKSNLPEELLSTYVKIGAIYKNKMVFDVALGFYLKALEISEDKNYSVIGHIYTSIGGIYYDQKDFENSNKYYQKSLETFTKNNEKQHIAASYNNIGEMFRFQKKYEEALKYYFLAMEINKEFNNDFYLAINYNNIGNVFLSQKKYKKAYEKIIACQKLLIKEGNVELLAASYSSVGEYYFAIGEYKKAVENYEKTLKFNLEEYPKKDIIEKDAYLGLSNSYRELGAVEKELESLKKYTELKDIVFNSEMHKAIFEVQTRYETRQKEEEIIHLHEKSKRDEAEKKKQRTNLIIVISLLVVVVLLLVYSYIVKSGALKQKTLLFEQSDKLSKLEIENKEIENRRLLVENKELEAKKLINRLKREKLSAELEHKERELSTTALHVIGKNEMLSNLKNSMEKLIEDGKSDPNSVLKSLVKEIDYNINLDEDWDIFKMHFEKVHPLFFSKLKESFSGLTVDELKLCAYLRINLSSKEISRVLNITQIAINKRRNRLRKKLDLSTSDDLFDFLNKL